jgi:hypothetical protein
MAASRPDFSTRSASRNCPIVVGLAGRGRVEQDGHGLGEGLGQVRERRSVQLGDRQRHRRHQQASRGRGLQQVRVDPMAHYCDDDVGK